MTIKRKSGSTMVDITNMRRRSGSSWVVPSNAYRRSGGTWVKVWPTVAPLTATVAPAYIYDRWELNTTGTLYAVANVTASGGSGTYTVTNMSSSLPVQGIEVSISGMTIDITATGRNTSRIQDIQLRVSDGTSYIDLVLSVHFDFGTLA